MNRDLAMPPAKRLDRVTADDLLSLVPGNSSAPLQVGAVLLLEVDSGFDPTRFLAELAGRLPRVRRLRQKLVRAPWGGGRPVWVDDPGFRTENHLAVVPGGPAAELSAVLEIAADLLAVPLPRDRPLWAARLVTGVGRDHAALIMVFHHVLADGLAGLAILRQLVDGAALGADTHFPRAAPSRHELVRDAAAERYRSIRHLGRFAGRLVHAAALLTPTLRARATPCSLNQPTGPHRRFALVEADLETIRDAAHQHAATIDDFALAAVARALNRLLVQRGEEFPSVVISVPFADRTPPAAGELGNHSGVIPLLIPATGGFEQRLASIVRITGQAKKSQRGASTAALGPAFRLLARVGLYQRFINHQRRIHTFVSNLQGPRTRLHLMGCPIGGIIPLSIAIGNVTVAFTVFSYAGCLTVTVNADPETCPDLTFLCAVLAEELRQPSTILTLADHAPETEVAFGL